MPKRRSKRNRRRRKQTKKIGGGTETEEAKVAKVAKAAEAKAVEAAIKEKYHAQLKKEMPIVEENVKKVEEEGVIHRKPNEKTINAVKQQQYSLKIKKSAINKEIKRFNHDISIFNFAEFIIKSLFFGVEEKDVESHVEDKLFKILQRLRLKVKKAIDKLSNQGKQGVSKEDANAIKEVLDQHFQLFHDSLINDLIQRRQMDEKENKILDFFKQYSKNIDNISDGELRLNRTPYEFDKVTRFLKAYQINQTKIVEALTNMLKKVPKIGVEALKIVPFIGDGVIFLDVIDDASEIAEDLATINAVSETLGGERYHPEQGQVSQLSEKNFPLPRPKVVSGVTLPLPRPKVVSGVTQSNPRSGRRGGATTTKKRRTPTKKSRTTPKKRRTTNTKKRRTTNTKKRRTKRHKRITRRKRN